MLSAEAPDSPAVPPPHRPDRLLAWPKVRDLTGLSRTTAWRLQKAGDFPEPVRISVNRVAWRQSDLEDWQASRSVRELSVRPPPTNRKPSAFARPGSPSSPSVPVPPPTEAMPVATPDPRFSQAQAPPHHPKTPGRRRKGGAEGQLDFGF